MVEMPGPWKTWKTKVRFPTFPTAPWKSPRRRFPHSHRAGDDSLFPEIQRRRRNGSLPSGARRNTTKGGSTRGKGPTQSSTLQAHAWTGKCGLRKSLPELPPAGYKLERVPAVPPYGADGLRRFRAPEHRCTISFDSRESRVYNWECPPKRAFFHFLNWSPNKST